MKYITPNRTPNPSLPPTCYGRLRQPPQAGERKRYAPKVKVYSVGGIVGGLLVEVDQVACYGTCYGIGRRAVSLLTGKQVRTKEEDERPAFAVAWGSARA